MHLAITTFNAIKASICEENNIIMEENFSHAKPMNAYREDIAHMA